MSDRADSYPSQLSDGQQQRVAIARAVVGEPQIILADEPTGNLDSRSGEAVVAVLDQLDESGTIICLVTHDPRYAEHAQRTVHLLDARIISGVSTKGRGGACRERLQTG